MVGSSVRNILAAWPVHAYACLGGIAGGPHNMAPNPLLEPNHYGRRGLAGLGQFGHRLFAARQLQPPRAAQFKR